MLKFWTDFFSAYIRVKLICNDFGWQKNRNKWSSDLFVLPSRDHPQPFTACSSGLCRAAVDLVSSSKGRDRQRPWDLKVGRVRKVRFGSTQQSNPDPSAHLARLATHWPEATNSAAARGLTPSMLQMERRSNRILTNLRSSKLSLSDALQSNLVQSAYSVNLRNKLVSKSHKFVFTIHFLDSIHTRHLCNIWFGTKD